MQSPERIWAWIYADPWGNELRWFEWQDHDPEKGETEYIRADLVDPAAIRETALREAAKLIDDFRRSPATAGLGCDNMIEAILALIDKKETQK